MISDEEKNLTNTQPDLAQLEHRRQQLDEPQQKQDLVGFSRIRLTAAARQHGADPKFVVSSDKAQLADYLIACERVKLDRQIAELKQPTTQERENRAEQGAIDAESA